MKKKIISIAIATVLAVSSTHALAETYDEDHTENKLNYTAIGIGATSGGLLLGPVGILVGGVIGSFYGSAEADDELQNIAQDIEKSVETATASDLDELVIQTEHNESDDLMLALASDVISFIEQDSAEASQLAPDRIKEIISNDFSISIHFKPGSVNVENLYSQQLATISDLLHEMPEMTLNLDAYSDRVGTASDNLQLSSERLQSVRYYFIKNGIEESRINIHAHGEKKFLSTAGELDAYMFDRRVVLSFKALIEQQQNNNVAVVDELPAQ